MTITANFENKVLEADVVGDVIRQVVKEANNLTDDVHADLDYARDKFRAMGLWTYRGGFHVAVHTHQANGEPAAERAVLVS